MIYIVRHGQTEKNKARLLQGRTNAPLNDAGRKQAEETAARLREAGIRFDKVYSSPLIRAVTTAGILAPEIPLFIDERLIEIDYGPYDGTDLINPVPEILYFFKDFVNHPAPEGVEPLRKIVERLGDFLEEIRPEAEKKNILISTHAIAMKGALEYLTPESHGGYWNKFIGNCAVYTAEVLPDGKWAAKALYETYGLP